MSRFSVGPGGFLLLALAVYLLDGQELAAVLLPVAAHEMGHIVALRLFGLHIQRVRLEAKGLCISYSGFCGTGGHLLAAAAGPAAGLLYAFGAAKLGACCSWDYLYLSAGISLLLSIFNLLPALPLDGGRILQLFLVMIGGERFAERLTAGMSWAVGLLLLLVGIGSLIRGWGFAPAIAALWLLLHPKSGRGLVKNQELL